jgi:mevalonate kinase
MGVKGSGHGKLLLFGEHAAVYGYPALGIALPETVELEIEHGPEWSLANVPRRYHTILQPVLERLDAHLHERYGADAAEHARGAVWFHQIVPTGIGFGSSAALCVALARGALGTVPAVQRHSVRDRDMEVWALANELERLFHGSPSGIDTGLATLGGAQSFTFDKPGLPQASPLPLPPGVIVAAATPRDSDTKTLVGALKERVQRREKRVIGELAKLGEIAREADALIRSSDEAANLAHLGALAGRAHRLLADLGLSTPITERCLATATDKGALGGKISGAGGGGAFFAVFEDPAAALETAGTLREILSGIDRDLPVRVIRAEEESLRLIEAAS